MLAEDYYPHSYIDMSDEEEVDESEIKNWITFVEKSESGISVGSGKNMVIKNNEGDIIVIDSYKVLPKEIYKELKEEGESLLEEIERFLNKE